MIDRVETLPAAEAEFQARSKMVDNATTATDEYFIRKPFEPDRRTAASDELTLHVALSTL